MPWWPSTPPMIMQMTISFSAVPMIEITPDFLDDLLFFYDTDAEDILNGFFWRLGRWRLWGRHYDHAVLPNHSTSLGTTVGCSNNGGAVGSPTVKSTQRSGPLMVCWPARCVRHDLEALRSTKAEGVSSNRRRQLMLLGFCRTNHRVNPGRTMWMAQDLKQEWMIDIFAAGGRV